MIPTFLSELVRTVIIMTITGGLLCLLLFLIKPIIRHRLPKSAQYYFWFVVLFSLLIPISRFVALPDTAPNIAPIHNMIEQNIVSITEETERFYRTWSDELRFFAPATSEQPARMTHYPREGAEPVMATASPPIPSLWVRGSTLFMQVYLWVVAFVFIYSLIGYTRFIVKLRRGHVEPRQSERDILEGLSKGKRLPRLIKSTIASTPMLIGVLRPTIVLPDREYSDEQLHGILLHELIHMRRFDVAVKWLSLFACAVHWFNPFVWVVRREIDRACELACDEAAIRNMDVNNRQNYGETLISVASDKKIPLPVLSTTMCAEKRAIKERLRAIMKSKKHTKLAIIASTLVFLAVALTACALGAARSASGNEIEPDLGSIFGNDAPYTVQDFAYQYIDNLIQELNVGVFPHGVDEDYFYVRPANILEIRINILEREASFNNILPQPIELWRLDFMILTNDLEDGYLRWGTFFPDEDGWVGQHTTWNNARTLLAFTVDGDHISLLGSIPWYMEETSYGLEGALHTFLQQQELSAESLSPRPNLRTQTPPLNIREWNEVDTAFLDGFGARWGLTFSERGDFASPNPYVERWWGHSQLQYHTILLWAEEELFDFRVVALGFEDTGDSMFFYVRHELDKVGWVAPNSLMMINASLIHYLIPRMGVTFTDSAGNHHRMLIRESMAGYPYPLFFLNVFDDSHFATWDDSIAPIPFVKREIGNYLVHGIGGYHIAVHPGNEDSPPWIYFAGSGFAIAGLENEAIEGSAHITQDSLRISFAVARNEIIMEHTDDPLGTLAGPVVEFEYMVDFGLVYLTLHPFEFQDDSHEHLHFDFTEESAIAFAELLKQALRMVIDFRSEFS